MPILLNNKMNNQFMLVPFQSLPPVFLAHKTMNRKLYSEKFIMNRFLAVLKTYRCKNILKLITKTIYGLFINAFTPYGRSQRLPQWPSR